jgi:hypothetical protein
MIRGIYVIGMDEVTVASLGHSPVQFGTAVLKIQAVPSHVGNLQALAGKVLGEPAYLAGNKAKAGGISLFGMLKENLRPQADTDQGFTVLGPLSDKGIETPLFKLIHGEFRFPNPGKDKPVRLFQIPGILRDAVVRSQVPKGKLNTADVTRIIVDYSCHGPILPVCVWAVKRDPNPADTNDMMSLDQLITLIQKVLLSPEVIIITLVIALYVNSVNYVVRYRKKPYQPKKPRVKKEKAAPEKPVEESEDDEDSGGK